MILMTTGLIILLLLMLRSFLNDPESFMNIYKNAYPSEWEKQELRERRRRGDYTKIYPVNFKTMLFGEKEA